MVESVVEELARKRLGRTLRGKWTLDSVLGVGGMATVYAATHRNGAKVAIKMLHPTISASDQIRARFLREGYLANKVEHSGVARVLDDDVDETDGCAFLVMDLIKGETLSERARKTLLTGAQALDVAEQVLETLVAAHEKGIVHRDLKPDNLLIDEKGRVFVLDFGIARLHDDVVSMTSTKSGSTLGTPGFMAPEQAMGKTKLVGPRTDLYSLGATLFAIVSGEFVHDAENAQEQMVLVATKPARSLTAVCPTMHPEVVAVVDRATQHDVEARHPNAAAMLEAVRRARTKLGLAVNVRRPTPPRPPPRREPRTGLDGSRADDSGGRPILKIFTPDARLANPVALTEAPRKMHDELHATDVELTDVELVPAVRADRPSADPAAFGTQAPTDSVPPPRRRTGLFVVLGAMAVLGVGTLVLIASRRPSGSSAGSAQASDSDSARTSPKNDDPSIGSPSSSAVSSATVGSASASASGSPSTPRPPRIQPPGKPTGASTTATTATTPIVPSAVPSSAPTPIASVVPPVATKPAPDPLGY